MILGLWIHPWDLLDYGVEKTYEYVESLGINSLSMAVRYIEERQAYPGPAIIYRCRSHRTYMSLRGTIYWHPDPSYYSGLPEKYRPRATAKVDIVKIFREKAENYSVKPVYWLPVLRWDRLAGEYPELAVKDVYGGLAGYKAQFLCPSNPVVRNLVLSVVEELCTRYDAVEIELDYIRYPEPVTNNASPLHMLALMPCHCEYCRRVMRNKGIELDHLDTRLKELIEVLIEAEDETGIICSKENPECWETIASMSYYYLGVKAPEAFKWLRARSEIIAELVSEIRDKTKSYGVELSADLTPPSYSWIVGQDYELLSPSLDRVKVMVYTEPFRRSPEKIPLDLALAKKLGREIELVAGISLWPPSTPQTIKRDLDLARPYTDGFYGYCFGWAPRRNLETYVSHIMKR